MLIKKKNLREENGKFKIESQIIITWRRKCKIYDRILNYNDLIGFQWKQEKHFHLSSLFWCIEKEKPNVATTTLRLPKDSL